MSALDRITEVLNASIALKRALSHLLLEENQAEYMAQIRQDARSLIRHAERFEKRAQRAACDLALQRKIE